MTKENKRIKILTLNIQKGWSLGRRKQTVELIKKSIQELGANIVSLQEVMGAFPEKEKKSQFEFLADGIWPHYAYGKNAIYSKGHHGNAILSETPFLKYENIDISNHRFERRGILHGIIHREDSIGADLHVMTVHLDLTAWGRGRQIEKVIDVINKSVPPKAPLILCGDFNDWRESLSSHLFNRLDLKEAFYEKYGVHANTFPTYMPFLKLDRIYYRNLNLLNVERLDTPDWHKLSDHLGLCAEFQFTESV